MLHRLGFVGFALGNHRTLAPYCSRPLRKAAIDVSMVFWCSGVRVMMFSVGFQGASFQANKPRVGIERLYVRALLFQLFDERRHTFTPFCFVSGSSEVFTRHSAPSFKWRRIVTRAFNHGLAGLRFRTRAPRKALPRAPSKARHAPSTAGPQAPVSEAPDPGRHHVGTPPRATSTESAIA
jgi:hypothetical protein